MAKKLKGNMAIAQSGGPSMVINQSLVGAVIEAAKHKEITGILGALHGIQGLMEDDFVDLRKESPANLELVAATPSSALGSVRKKPTADDCCRVFDVMQRRDIRYLFYIGGNDSAETAGILSEEAHKGNFDFRCFHIPKTIDNDLLENDHTPGFGSAAKFVACAFMGDNLDSAALPGVKIDVVMGRNAGFLTAASALARVHPNDGPHLIYLPERPFDMASFVKDVHVVYEKLGRCLIAVSEGIANDKGEPIVASFLKETDGFGNVQLSGTGALGDLLSREIKKVGKISRIRADTFGYLQRSFPGMISQVDAREARKVGSEAVKLAVKGIREGSVAIRRKPGSAYRITYERVGLSQVARKTRHMPPEFIAKSGTDVTQAFIEYARPIVGHLPKIGHLKKVPASR